MGVISEGDCNQNRKALPNKLLIAAVLNKIPFKPDQNKYYRNYYYYCIIHWMVLLPVNSAIHLLNKITTLVEIKYTISILQVYFICTSQKKSTFEVYLVCTSRKKV